MKYFKAIYDTRDGEHEYEEMGVLSAQTVEEADKKAKKGKELFNRYGWEEFCIYSHLEEIPQKEYDVLRKHTTDIDQ